MCLGPIVIPLVVRGEDKEDRIGAAIEEARRHEHDHDTVGTDGSRLSGGWVGGGVTWYEAVAAWEPPVSVSRREAMRIGERRERAGRIYHDRHRSHRGAQSG